jgi:AraC family transcriptional regulator
VASFSELKTCIEGSFAARKSWIISKMNMRAKAIQATWTTVYDDRYLNIEECVTLGDWSGGDYSLVHDHPEVQITILAGRSCMDASSSTDCGQRRHKRVSAGEICVTPSCQPHAMDWHEAGGSMIIGVSPQFIVEALECTPNAAVNLDGRYGTTDAFVQHLANLLRRGKNGGRPVSRLKAESITVVMLAHLSRRDGTAGVAHQREIAPIVTGRLAHVVEYIENNLNEQLSLVALARIAQTSAFHFARQFKSSTGLTPHQYVMQRRIDRARRLLRDPRLSIADVAFDCGFATQAHLTAVFRKLVGSTPKAYRMIS